MYVEWYRKKFGYARRIDLRHLQSGAESLGLARIESRWLLPFEVTYAPDEWYPLIARLRRQYPSARAYDHQEIARHVDPRIASSQTRADEILHYPFDLARPLGPQLQHAKSFLSESQQYLHRFIAEEVASLRQPSKHLWRDAYVFIAKEVTGKTSAQIAKEVFPGADGDSGTKNVERILGKVRLALERSEWIGPFEDLI